MKKLILTALVSLGLVASALAQTVIRISEDQYVGYDGDCKVYFRPNYGYYQVCENGPPVYMSWDIEQWSWRHPRHHSFWGGHRHWEHHNGRFEGERHHRR